VQHRTSAESNAYERIVVNEALRCHSLSDIPKSYKMWIQQHEWCLRVYVQLQVVSQTKGVNLTGLLGDIKEDWGSRDGSPPAGSRGGAPVGAMGNLVPQKLKLFL